MAQIGGAAATMIDPTAWFRTSLNYRAEEKVVGEVFSVVNRKVSINVIAK
jgi:hypothetical protein